MMSKLLEEDPQGLELAITDILSHSFIVTHPVPDQTGPVYTFKLKDLPAQMELDKINPPHYRAGDLTVECIDVIEALGLGYHLGCALKYIWRAGHKTGEPVLDDLNKAYYYLNRHIGNLELAEDVRQLAAQPMPIAEHLSLPLEEDPLELKSGYTPPVEFPTLPAKEILRQAFNMVTGRGN